MVFAAVDGPSAAAGVLDCRGLGFQFLEVGAPGGEDGSGEYYGEQQRDMSEQQVSQLERG